jgi:hypothetical protein
VIKDSLHCTTFPLKCRQQIGAFLLRAKEVTMQTLFSASRSLVAFLRD